jgi:hypothetical protein
MSVLPPNGVHDPTLQGTYAQDAPMDASIGLRIVVRGCVSYVQESPRAGEPQDVRRIRHTSRLERVERK